MFIIIYPSMLFSVFPLSHYFVVTCSILFIVSFLPGFAGVEMKVSRKWPPYFNKVVVRSVYILLSPRHCLWDFTGCVVV